ncbi:MAG: hypothetical protein OEM96_03280 [Gemmatimonadota bacterium]|nr:hypothetical protein [Gemmatimonadota bacterium]
MTMPRFSSAKPWRPVGLASLAFWMVACGGSVAPDSSVAPAAAIAQNPDGWSAELEAASSANRPIGPKGYGTLTQDDITVLVQAGNVRIKVVPLSEWAIRATAPDTYRRLNGYKVARGQEILERSSRAGERGWPLVLFVTYFSQAVEETFEPYDLQIRNRGFLYRPLDILPVTPDFMRERLRQQETQIALYLFSADIDLDLQTEVAYGGASSARWDGIRLNLDSELAKATSRAGAHPGEARDEP